MPSGGRRGDEEGHPPGARGLYADPACPAWERPEDWALLYATVVYEVTVEILTGKRRPLAVAERWRGSVGMEARELQERGETCSKQIELRT